MTAANPLRVVAATDDQAHLSLPAWVYRDAEFFEAEKTQVLRAAWQVVCHDSDVAGAGDWHALDYLGEGIIVVRGDDGAVRAFTNVCRHRGSRLLDGNSGCAKKLVCPYHAWTYGLDGRLTGLPGKSQYPGLALADHGLVPVDLEVWQGFIFVRLERRGPSVAEMMAPYLAEILPYRFGELRALGRVTLRPRPVNWKNIADNYSDGLHIPVAHPGLKRLFGASYGIAAEAHCDKMWGDIGPDGGSSWSERAYRKLLPRVDHLDDAGQRRWLYFKLWPNVAFDIYPDQIDFMQFLPVSATETLIREISYAIPDERREMKAARYLNWRINRQVNAEDTELVARVQAGMASATFSQGPLGDSEVCLKSFATKLRAAIPAARQAEPPAAGWSRH